MIRGKWFDENVFVLFSKTPDREVAFFTSMGLIFDKEKHDGSPEHWAAQVGDKVLEIYPTNKVP